MKKLLRLILSLIMAFLFCGALNTTGVVFAVEVQQETEENTESSINENELKMTLIDLNINGDSTLIQYNGINILIDAGGVLASSDYIYNKIKDLDTLHYVIFTHADKDHIVNFSTNAKSALNRWLSVKNNKIETLIDFDITNDKSISRSLYPQQKDLFVSQSYNEYKEFRDNNIRSNKIENYYTASQCVYKERGLANPPIGAEGAKSFFSFNDGNDNNGIRILYNYFYDHSIYNRKTAQGCERNLLAVCTLITVDDKKLLFTGDLEEFDSSNEQDSDDPSEKEYDVDNTKAYQRVYGESYLVAFNYEYLKDGVTYYKAAHHGSRTSNSSNLMDVIRPNYVGISCVAPRATSARKKQLYPDEVALNNICKWTDKIFLTSEYQDDNTSDSTIGKLHGDIYYSYNTDSKEEKFYSETEKNEYSIFTDKWFVQNRFISFNIFTLGQTDGIFFKNVDMSDVNALRTKILSESEVRDATSQSHVIDLQMFFEGVEKGVNDKKEIKVTNEINNCTYIKIGLIDILIDSGGGTGTTAADHRPDNVSKIDKLCNDGVLECLIVTSFNRESYYDLISDNGLLKNTKSIKKILNYIHYNNGKLNLDNSCKKDIEKLEQNSLIKNANSICSDSIKKITILKAKEVSDISLNFYDLDLEKIYDFNFTDPRKYSVMFNLTANVGKQKFKYLNLGYISKGEVYEQLLDIYANEFSDVDILEMPSHGRYNKTEKSESLLKQMKTAIYLYNGLLDLNSAIFEQSMYVRANGVKNIYATTLASSSASKKNEDLATNIINRIGFKTSDSDKRIITYSTKYYYYFASNLSLSQPAKQQLDRVR